MNLRFCKTGVEPENYMPDGIKAVDLAWCRQRSSAVQPNFSWHQDLMFVLQYNWRILMNFRAVQIMSARPTAGR